MISRCGDQGIVLEGNKKDKETGWYYLIEQSNALSIPYSQKRESQLVSFFRITEEKLLPRSPFINHSFRYQVNNNNKNHEKKNSSYVNKLKDHLNTYSQNIMLPRHDTDCGKFLVCFIIYVTHVGTHMKVKCIFRCSFTLKTQKYRGYY